MWHGCEAVGHFHGVDVKSNENSNCKRGIVKGRFGSEWYGYLTVFAESGRYIPDMGYGSCAVDRRAYLDVGIVRRYSANRNTPIRRDCFGSPLCKQGIVNGVYHLVAIDKQP